MKFTWGHGIIVFFVIFFTWIISFVIFTLSQNNDLVAKNYYKQGAEYSKKMEIDKRSAIFKDSISIVNTAQGVAVNFAPSLTNLPTEKEVYFYRPSSEKDDIRINVPTGEKSLLLSNNKVIKGRYNVSISWVQKNNKFIVSKDFIVR